MNTFDSTKASLKNDLLEKIKQGAIQLPDFQRGWVWDDDHIQALLVSVAQSFPIGTVMLLETGGDVRFQTRPVEGVEDIILPHIQPERLILDGQQRLTTLTQALMLDAPVSTTTAKKKPIKRYYYFDIKKALDAPHLLEEAIVAVDQHRQLRTNFGKDIALDLSTIKQECQQLYFPCNRIMEAQKWMLDLAHFCPHQLETYTRFYQQIPLPFQEYHLPIIILQKETPKEAVCIVFEKVNTGGVSLNVFELITASYAAEGYNLRDDWLGSTVRKVVSRKNRTQQHALLKNIQATDFLQVITIIHTHELRQNDLAVGKAGKQARAVSAKRTDMLQLPLCAWQKWADKIESGFKHTDSFLRQECVYSHKELPYGTQLIPLAAVMTQLQERWHEPQIYTKLARWYWCGVLGELYGGAVETRSANDYVDLLLWFEDDNATPRTVRDAYFQPERFDSLRTRLSAAYKGINLLVLREGAKDWFWKGSVKELDVNEVALDIHHIFPRAWCEKQGIPKERYDTILNKTPISYKTNRIIGGEAPSKYLLQLQEKAQFTADEIDVLLVTHAIDPTHMRADDFDDFIENRRKQLSQLIAKAMGKDVVLAQELQTA